MKTTKYLTPIAVMLTASCTSCNQQNHSNAPMEHGDTVTTHATLLDIVEYPAYTTVAIKNPWDTTAILAKYILVGRDIPSDSLPTPPQGTTLIRIPLQTSLVYSSVYGGIIAELQATEAITAVTDGKYFNTPAIKKAIAEKRITDVGNSMSPSVEQIVGIDPQAILTSPYQNSGHGAIETLGTPIIEMADYMENTPLGRAEWIKLIGRLYGRSKQADSTFNAVVANYTSLRQSTQAVTERPVVITEQATSGTWAMPGGNSYMAAMLSDAGADYPWKDNPSTGSIELPLAAVLDKADKADYWFIKSYGPLTLASIGNENAINKRIKAYREANVYVCNTAEIPLFDEFPFHPELLLADYISIIHPEIANGTVRYFFKTE